MGALKLALLPFDSKFISLLDNSLPNLYLLMNLRSRQVGETDSQTSINCVNIYGLFYLVVGGLKISSGFSTIQILGFTLNF